MKKSILIGVSIMTVLAILLTAVALGFGDTKTRFNAFIDAKANEQGAEKATVEATSTPAPVPIQENAAETAIAGAQAKVSFKILQPSYVPTGYTLNIPQVSGTKFKGVSLEAEQVMLPYTNEKETLNLKELFPIKEDTDVSGSVSKTPYEFVDINGVRGRFLEEASGIKSLDWKIGNLSLTINSYAYKENNFTRATLNKEEMLRMARSVK